MRIAASDFSRVLRPAFEASARHLPYLIILAATSLLVYRDYWMGDRVITSKDFLTGLYPLFNFQADCLQEGSWPLWNPFMNYGFPILEHISSTVFFPSHLIIGLLSGSSLRILQWDLLGWIVVGGFGVYLCVREFGHSSTAALTAGICYMYCGQSMILPQWLHIVYNASCFPFLIYGYHRARKAGDAFSLISIAFMAMPILGGYVATSVLGMYFFIAYVAVDCLLERRFLFAVKYLPITIVSAFLLLLPKLVPFYNGMMMGPRTASYEPSKDPLNIINTYNFLSLFLPVKFFFSLYLGEIIILAFFYGALKRKLTVNAPLVMTLLTAWFLMVDAAGNVSLFREASYVLPLLKVIRNEWINWYYPSLFAILYASGYIDGLLSDFGRGLKIAAVGLYLALLTVFFFSAYDRSLYLSAFIAHLLLALCWLAIVSYRGKRLQSMLAVALITVEFLAVFGRVGVDEPPVREGDKLKIAVGDQLVVSPSYRDNYVMRPKFYAFMTPDETRPAISDSRKWPYLISGLGGAPTYNMFPEQYGYFIDYMNQKRFAGWWHNGTERFDFIQLKDSPRLAAMEGQPLFSLFDRATQRPVENAVSFDGISCSSFDFGVNASSDGFFLLRQMFDPRWRVYVDGAEQPVRQADTYFMGLDMGPGKHRVEFRFRDRSFTVSLFISLATLIGLFIAAFVRSRRCPAAGAENRL
ncbi:MAG: YfhO family protein [Nitrospirae bacterium]|nr:YfhO family protein [Nitrospirota bacterium]